MRFNSSFFNPSLLIWFTGKYLVVFCVLFLIGIILYKSFHGPDDESINPENVTTQRKSGDDRSLEIFSRLMTSFVLLTVAIAHCSRSAFVVKMVSYFPRLTALSCLGVFLATNAVLKNTPDDADFRYGRTILWVLQSIIMAPCFAFFSNEICIKAGGATVLISLLAKILAPYWTDDMHERVKIPIFWSYMAICVTAMIYLTIRPPLNFWATCIVAMNIYGGILLYFAAFVTNFQLTMKEMMYNDNVNVLYAASTLFVSCLNLYFRLALYNIVGDLLLNKDFACR